MAKMLAHNVTDSPVVVDQAGHTLGGGERGDVDPTTPQVQAAVAAGLLNLREKPAKNPPPPAGKTKGSGQ